MQRMNRNIIRIASTPYRRHVHNPVAEDASDLDQEQRIVATLSKNPRTLQALWQEYEIGGPGRKPVKDWTAQERGKQKNSFYKRKFFLIKFQQWLGLELRQMMHVNGFIQLMGTTKVLLKY